MDETAACRSTTAGVSSLLSSTKMTSASMPWSAGDRAARNGSMLAASLRVGTTTESSRAMYLYMAPVPNSVSWTGDRDRRPKRPVSAGGLPVEADDGGQALVGVPRGRRQVEHDHVRDRLTRRQDRQVVELRRPVGERRQRRRGGAELGIDPHLEVVPEVVVIRVLGAQRERVGHTAGVRDRHHLGNRVARRRVADAD